MADYPLKNPSKLPIICFAHIEKCAKKIQRNLRKCVSEAGYKKAFKPKFSTCQDGSLVEFQDQNQRLLGVHVQSQVNSLYLHLGSLCHKMKERAV